MKFLLAAINAKYIHSNLGIYSLKAYGKKHVPELCIEIGEYTINHQMDQILRDIYVKQPDAVGFSCYIWNITYVKELIRDLKKVLPQIDIWLGGPEVSYCAGQLLKEEKNITGIMCGEGEHTFSLLLKAYKQMEERGKGALKEKDSFSQIPGLVYRGPEGNIIENHPGPLLSMDELPFSYSDLKDLENRIIYYESSRGCPFSCSYCLSSIDKSVRFRSLELVKKEIDFFLEKQAPQVKFVDRTFNCRKDRTIEIWNYILNHDNGITNFHFEIAADLLDQEEIEILRKMRPGLVQLEIGVQTTNLDTIQAICRKTDLNKLKAAVEAVNQGKNVHQHLDLIAGLPFEDYESFQKSFDQVYYMEPEQLQLGFLKVLKGSKMKEMAKQYGLKYRSCPPYEVLSTSWLTYEEVIRLKDIEEMVEVYYNSGQFTKTIKLLETLFPSPFKMFEYLAAYYSQKGLFSVKHSRLARFEILYQFVCIYGKGREQEFRDCLMYDLYLREKAKSRPSFASDQTPYKEDIKKYYGEKGKKGPAHIEVMENGSYIYFDYEDRDPLTYNARTKILRGKTERTQDGKTRDKGRA